MTAIRLESPITTTSSLPVHELEVFWSKPISIIPETKNNIPYPLYALPPIIQNAISAYQQYGQQPLPLIACSALANVSLACQTLGNVARDRMLVSPVSLYFLVVANSGERKSAADYAFSQAIREWQLQTRDKLGPEVRIAQTVYHAWKVEREGLLSQIRRSSLVGKNTKILRQMLIELVANKPDVPLLPVLFFEDATQEALASHIAHGWPSASLWSDEGGIVMSGHGMQQNATKFIALLNRLWDGKAFIAHRKTTKSFTVANRRLTVNLMMQPIILEQMLSKNGGISRQSGFLARSLVAYPESSMGARYYQEPPESLASLPEFHSRLLACLNSSWSIDKNGCHNLPTLTLSHQAKINWVSFFNKIETGLKNAHQWSSIKDFASKSAENVVRLAALFHLFDGKTSEISAEYIDNAAEIIYWHLLEIKIILGETPQTVRQQDAIRLLQWIRDKGLTETSPRYLQQYGPIRAKKCRDCAVQILSEHDYLKEIRRDGKTILLVNPKC